MLPGTKLIPIINEIILDKIDENADSVGFIFPIHAFTLPVPVKIFLKKISFLSSSYTYAIATRGGAPCNVFKDMKRLLKKQRVQLDSYFFMNMPNNFTHVADTPTEDEILELNRFALVKTAMIADVISSKRRYHDKGYNKSFFRKQILFPTVSAVLRNTRYLNTDKKFYTDPECTGCGLCTKLCPVNRIELDEGKPYWNNDSSCVFCFACFNFCPNRAIQIKGSKSAIKGRYYHPMVIPNEIALQKTQGK